MWQLDYWTVGCHNNFLGSVPQMNIFEVPFLLWSNILLTFFIFLDWKLKLAFIFET